MSKALKELDASKAGVSQGELEEAFANLDALKAELEEADEVLGKALSEKEKKAEALQVSKEKALAASQFRDPIYQEWQRADWIVRNADPDQPPPLVGQNGPRIIAKRAS